MKSQIFKTIIEKDIITNFIKNISLNNGNHLEISKYCFKKIQLLNNNTIKDFYDTIINNYYDAKKKYITCQLTYNSFMTVIRQLCKMHNIHFISKIIYNKSSYEIVYYIYL